MKPVLSILFLTLMQCVSIAQTLHYDVIKGDKNIGAMTITRNVTGNVEEISFESHVSFRVLVTLNLDYTQYEKFVDGHLNWGKALSVLSGRTQKDSRVVANEAGYRLTIDGVSAQLNKEISYSVSQIYFTEPPDGQLVFSQQFGQFFRFEEIGEHEYRMISPDGNNYYTYTNGICTEVQVDRDFANFSFVIQPASMEAVEQQADSLYVRARIPD